MRHVRRIAKWTGLTLALLIAAAWTVSLWWVFSNIKTYPTEVIFLGVSRGCLSRGVLLTPPGRQLRPIEPGWQVIPDWQAIPGLGRILWLPKVSNTPPLSSVKVPLWIPFVLIVIPTAWLFWSDRRVRRGGAGCCRCGYDLAGLPPDTACPECGRKGKAQTSKQHSSNGQSLRPFVP